MSVAELSILVKSICEENDEDDEKQEVRIDII